MNRHERRAKGAKSKQQEVIAQNIAHARQLVRAGNLKDADLLYRTVLDADKRNPVALLDYAQLCYQRGLIDQAGKYYDDLLKVQPRNHLAMTGLAMIAQDQGDADKAFTFAARIREGNPDHEILSKLALLYRQGGRNQDAADCARQAIAQNSDFIMPYYHLREIYRFENAEDPVFQNMLRLDARRDQLKPAEQILLSFALAQASLQLGRDEEAFAQYAAGNAVRYAQYGGYPIDDFERYADSIIALCGKDFVQRMQGVSTCDSARPIFIVGMPRSGSTLVDQILSSHPDVGSMGETPALLATLPVTPNTVAPNLIRPGMASVTQQLIDGLTPALVNDIAAVYLKKIDKPQTAGKPHVVDKMLFNYLLVGLVRVIFPKAKIIHTTRDPMDMGLSIWQQLFGEKVMAFSYNLEDIGRYYKAYKKVMQHWDMIFPGDIHEVSYEKMIVDQEGETRCLLEYCGLTWDERCLKFNETERQVKTASQQQVRRGLYTTSVGKWKKYEKYLGPLSTVLNYSSEREV